MEKEVFIRSISPFVPIASAPLLFELIKNEQVKLKITKGRKTKFGDYRPPYKNKGQQISINGNLNKYAFLITFIHEAAHLKVFMQSRSLKNPHGKAWKLKFKELATPFLNKDIFPPDVLDAFTNYLINPKASSSSDINLYKALRNQDENNECTFLIELPKGTRFEYNGRFFEKEEKRRTRILCRELNTKKQYLFSPVAEVKVNKR